MKVNAALTTGALIAMQGAHIPQPTRSSASGLPGLNSFNAPFAGGRRSADFVGALAHSLGGLTEGHMSALARDLALNYS